MADAASPKKRGRPAKKDAAEHKEKEVRPNLIPCSIIAMWFQFIYIVCLTNKEPKKAEKRAAAPAPAAAVESGESQVKRGRGRPKGSGKKASGAAGASAAKSKVCFLFYLKKIIFSHSRITYYYTINFWVKLI